jgi:DNA-binding GntR family transcriptional regulator
LAARRSELRRVLEALAVRLACHRATETIRKQMAAMVDLLAKDTHELIVAGAANDYLADAMAPLQGLSRRFWFTHVVDHHARDHRRLQAAHRDSGGNPPTRRRGG